ncbi:MAG: hypothetical protein PHO52_11120, partial [Sulfuricurvum sp.]|uniref:hypothetical protein n=1 Tax=Sulfuricurvum sp. TaxID=2025608 RepID=UPI00260F83E5
FAYRCIAKDGSNNFISISGIIPSSDTTKWARVQGGVTTASALTFTPNGDISSVNVQDAIVELRNDTDEKIAANTASIAAKADQISTYTKTETDNRIAAVVGAAPAALDTLAKIAAQLASDESAAGALTIAVAGKLDISGGTTTGRTVFKEIAETVYALSGTTPVLSSANGNLQTWVLSANSTPTDGLNSGDTITLHIDDGTAYTVNWTSMPIHWIGSSAPIIATTGYSVITLWKIGTMVIGMAGGDVV